MIRAFTLCLSLAGCVVLAPVVDEIPAPPGPSDDACETVPCSRLSDPPPDTFDPTTLDPPEPTCESASLAMTLTDDATLDASSLGCVSLDVTFAPSPTRTAETPISLQIVGSDLQQLVVHAHSSVALAELAIATAHAEDVELHLDGAVRLSIDHTTGNRLLLDLGGADPIEPPEALMTSCSFLSITAVGPRAPIRLRDCSIGTSSLQMRSIAFERGEVGRSRIEGELVELLDTMTIGTQIAADRIIVTGGTIDGSYIDRCGSLTLAATQVRNSLIERCLDPIDAQTSSIGYSAVRGAVAGASGTIIHTALGGDVILPRGTLQNDAFCGTTRIEATDLECPLCAPSAPPDVCVRSFSEADACPGLCGTSCTTGTQTHSSPMQADMMACAP